MTYEEAASIVRAPLRSTPRNRELVRFASLAANSHNTQPWTFTATADRIVIAPDFTRMVMIPGMAYYADDSSDTGDGAPSFDCEDMNHDGFYIERNATPGYQAGTTDIAIFYEGSIRQTAIIGLGGKNVTNDTAFGLRTPVEQAEQIKIRHGC